jgi:hypothetical protein
MVTTGMSQFRWLHIHPGTTVKLEIKYSYCKHKPLRISITKCVCFSFFKCTSQLGIEHCCVFLSCRFPSDGNKKPFDSIQHSKLEPPQMKNGKLILTLTLLRTDVTDFFEKNSENAYFPENGWFEKLMVPSAILHFGGNFYVLPLVTEVAISP